MRLGWFVVYLVVIIGIVKAELPKGFREVKKVNETPKPKPTPTPRPTPEPPTASRDIHAVSGPLLVLLGGLTGGIWVENAVERVLLAARRGRMAMPSDGDACFVRDALVFARDGGGEGAGKEEEGRVWIGLQEAAHSGRIPQTCFASDSGGYRWEVCPFANATQLDTKEPENTWSSSAPFWGMLGVWDGFQSVQGEENGDEEVEQGGELGCLGGSASGGLEALFSDGDECPNAKKRKMTMRLRCPSETIVAFAQRAISLWEEHAPKHPIITPCSPEEREEGEDGGEVLGEKEEEEKEEEEEEEMVGEDLGEVEGCEMGELGEELFGSDEDVIEKVECWSTWYDSRTSLLLSILSFYLHHTPNSFQPPPLSTHFSHCSIHMLEPTPSPSSPPSTPTTASSARFLATVTEPETCEYEAEAASLEACLAPLDSPWAIIHPTSSSQPPPSPSPSPSPTPEPSPPEEKQCPSIQEQLNHLSTSLPSNTINLDFENIQLAVDAPSLLKQVATFIQDTVESNQNHENT